MMVDHDRDEDFRPVPDEDGEWWSDDDDGWSDDGILAAHIAADDIEAMRFEEEQAAAEPDFERGGWCSLHNRPHHLAGLACEVYSAELFQR